MRPMFYTKPFLKASNAANALYETILKSGNSLYYYHHVTNIFCKITFYFTVQGTFTTIKVPNFPEISAYKISSDTLTINSDFFPPPHEFMIFHTAQNILACDVTTIQKSKPRYPDRHFSLEQPKKK